jgi:hypothetical protein
MLDLSIVAGQNEKFSLHVVLELEPIGQPFIAVRDHGIPLYLFSNPEKPSVRVVGVTDPFIIAQRRRRIRTHGCSSRRSRHEKIIRHNSYRPEPDENITGPSGNSARGPIRLVVVNPGRTISRKKTSRLSMTGRSQRTCVGRAFLPDASHPTPRHKA